jgi:hypothetical protein
MISRTHRMNSPDAWKWWSHDSRRLMRSIDWSVNDEYMKSLYHFLLSGSLECHRIWII